MRQRACVQCFVLLGEEGNNRQKHRTASGGFLFRRAWLGLAGLRRLKIFSETTFSDGCTGAGREIRGDIR